MGSLNEIVFVYVLLLGNDNYYTGITNNPFRRLKEHYTGHSRYTSYFTVIALVFLKPYPSRKKARVIEVKIKQVGAKRYVTKCKFNDGYSLLYPIQDIIAMDESIHPLKQLKTIQNKFLYFRSPPLK